MKKLHKADSEEGTCYHPIGKFSRINRTSFFRPSILSSDSEDISTPCLYCPTKPCYSFHPDESKMDRTASGLLVCPVRAISLNNEQCTIEINDNCVGCGLCIFRCPFGSIFFSAQGKAKVLNASEDYFISCSVSSFNEKLKDIECNLEIPKSDLLRFSQTIKDNLRGFGKEVYYPLVGKYLISVGFPTKISRIGDTNIRMDAIMVSKLGKIPIEIKSPTETEKISVKAVRQALENKVILLSRETGSPIPKETTSLIVGYKKPAARSEVMELIEDIFNTYTISIGILSLEHLITLAYKSYFSDSFNIVQILTLKGLLDEETI